MTDDLRITILACTSEPQEGNKKKIKKFFDKAIYFPFPDYTTRRLMWKTFIENMVNSELIALGNEIEGSTTGSSLSRV